MDSLQSFDDNAPIERVITALLKDGAVILDKLISDDEAEQLKAEIEPAYDAFHGKANSKFYGFKTRRALKLFEYSNKAIEVCSHPRVLEIADNILLPHCDYYQIDKSVGIEIFPGEDRQAIHRDDVQYPIQMQGMNLMFSCLVALDEFTNDNGATLVVKNNRSIHNEPTYDQACSAVMSKGSAVVYLGSTYHGGGSNDSLHSRSALATMYSLGWLRQAENPYLSLAPQTVEKLPLRTQQLLGYRQFGKYLGHYPRDPERRYPGGY
ncbi:phytanoyl-CoA dioxygenase family protein [Alkalimonas collagenimarina]|uniref:Phytanoyl-CoA dioxygenase family protein n=1 Tax=Alkalimonas collagenimarina TaxID=400390 RepID=A0ABT9H0X4_9GAMM|nr:phytanoyl-CoA dioxygenase family protein [Alkalimonas collagenimarina]MDP4536975.1 phytanoyl-CoA dioxygenase family protein [Alkalimonas collagenimarina]